MYKDLQAILSIIQQSEHLSNKEKTALLKAAKAVDKELEKTSFKLKETIEELEHKRKAVEAQAREAEIESALERVRARTMSMQKTSEFVEVIDVIGEQFIKLGFDFDWVNFSANGIDVSNGIDIWNFVVIPGKYKGANRVFIPFFDHPVFTVAYEKFQEYRATGNDFYALQLDKETKDKFADHLFANTVYKDLPDELKKIHYDGNGYITSSVFLKDTWLSIGSYKGKPFTDEQNTILKRLANSFGQAYTRFLDLKKAEAQAREAQIELGLERVRARAMAMQTSEELNALIGIVFTELTKLDLVLTRCVIIIYDAETKGAQWWMANSEAPSVPMNFFVKYANLPFFNMHLKGWEERDLKWQYILEGENKIVTDNFLFNETELKTLPDFVIEGMKAPHKVYLNVSFNNFGNLTLATLEPLSEKHFDILLRFAKVFDLTYTRFNDLQKAEAQAREAQIEASIERIRSRTMGMQKSNQLVEVVALLSKELVSLGIKQFATCGYVEIEEENKRQLSYLTNSDAGSLESFYLPLTGEPIFDERYNAWKRQEPVLRQIVYAEDLKRHLDFAYSGFGSKEAEEVGRNLFPNPTIFYSSNFSYGYLSLVTGTMLTEEEELLMARFTRMFEQTYTRFLDLKKAEAQARESQIQLALERVRARTMAMQKSDELAETASVLFQQMNALGNTPERLNIGVINEEKGFIETWATEQDGHKINHSFNARLDEPTIAKLYKGWKAKKSSMTVDLSGKELKQWIDYLQNELKMPVNEELLQNRRVQSVAYFKEGFILMTTPEPLPAETISLLERFADVFNLTYTRFLDLQKAEAQAREAKIETSLERVRSRSLAMHKSDEIQEVINEVFLRLKELEINLDSANILIFENGSKDTICWTGSAANNSTSSLFRYADIDLLKDLIKAKENQLDLFTHQYSHEQKNNFFNYVFETTALKETPNDHKQFILGAACHTVSVAFSKNIAINLNSYSRESFTESENNIAKRFAKVFEQSYTRFLDLQKAEAQAREAQIEASLERVRSHTMAMHKSTDLLEVISVLSEQFQHLGFKIHSANFNTSYRQKDWNLWLYNPGTPMFPDQIHIPYLNNPFFNRTLESLANGADFTAFVFTKEEKDGFLDHLYSTTIAINTSEERKRFAYNAPGFAWSTVYLKNTALTIANYDAEPYTEEQNAILRKFGNVFEQSYTRFLDLQKAEAQAQEAKIETALEKVRSRSLAMHKSEEIQEVINEVFIRLKELEINLDSANIFIFEKGSKDTICWTGSTASNSTSSLLRYADIDFLKDLIKAKENQLDLFTHQYSHEQKNNFFNYVYETTALKETPNDRKQFILGAACHTVSVAFSKNIAINLNSYSRESFTESENNIAKRFAKVFEQSYTRFLDLQKAEAQAREAQIEAALERVRGKAMSMHSSRDLADTIDVFYHEMELLSITPRRCGVGLMDKETHVVELSTMNTTEQGDSIEIIGKLKLTGHPVLEGIYDNWILQKEYHPVLRGNEIKEYYKLIRPQIAYPDYPTDMAQYGYFFFFNEGGVYAWTEKELSEDELKIYRRFTSVLSLTYKRYKDLKDAEANAKEAIKRASLDRVRAETASMRTTGDLERITPLIWNELTTLGVPFIRCGVFIMDEQKELIHSFLSTPDGKAIAAFQLPYDSAGELSKVLVCWHKKEMFKDHWDEATFAEWTKSLAQQGAIASEEKYSTTHHPVNLDLHFLPFLQGMLYVGSETPLRDEEIHLVQTLADAFSTAYARYEDFNKLESAKAQIEKTLVDLKQAQAQLVQSEKMASLGELTAGIAHEIQNPLNFVNNFSDVNQELLVEMKDEMKKGNLEEADSIANDVIENEQKINHHGKRAGDIVKGMLQHSRKSSGIKEPTDINALADEYLRLSYHGLRAKDKSFNATMKTDFDSSIGKINIIPQDIGRVLLNLYNNAFYAVQQKLLSKDLPGFENLAGLAAYEPTVSVSTKKSENHVIITVSDNGNGIPQKVIDKIFQPFFTTKPTGSGTGLGLSLAYDIIKAHGGTLKVESLSAEAAAQAGKEGEGSEFLIQLPIE